MAKHENRHDTHDSHPDPHTESGATEYGEHRDHTQASHAPSVRSDAEARDRFGGINWGAAFFGWLVAVAIAILLSSIVGAVASAVGASQNFTQTDAERDAGTVGIVAAAVLLAIMLIAYYTGGYVAGRMSRFDGGKQGFAVWVIGLLVTILAVVLGAVFGSEYNILDRVDLPRIPIPTETLGWGGIITGLAILLGTLLAAMAGGKVGHRYHDKVDRAAYR
jgi:amino acid transporter